MLNRLKINGKRSVTEKSVRVGDVDDGTAAASTVSGSESVVNSKYLLIVPAGAWLYICLILPAQLKGRKE